MGLILLRDLQYRRWRVLLTVVLMGIVMTLLFVMAGLVGQFNAEPKLATEFVGGDDHWVVASGSGGPLTSPKVLPRADFPPIADGQAVLFSPSALNGYRVFIAATDNDADNRITESLADGRLPTTSGEIAIDATAGLDVDTSANLGGTEVTIVGLVDDATILAGVPLVVATPAFARDVVAGGADVASAVLTSNPSPELPPSFTVLSPSEVADDTLRPLENAISSVSLVRLLLWMITAIVIAAVVYITALERTGDFAVLKAVGGRTRDLAGSLLLQGLIMTMAAVGIAMALQTIVAPLFPMIIRVPAAAWWQIPVVAAVVSVVAGMAGVSKVRSTSAAEAFG